MPSELKLIKTAIDDFAKVENALETYADLKEEYLSLKALLTVAGVNLTELDKIKE